MVVGTGPAHASADDAATPTRRLPVYGDGLGLQLHA